MFKNEPSSKKRFLTTTETELELATNSGRKISELLADDRRLTLRNWR
jgi:hypothetical protein